jgi:adenosine deaminase
MSIVQVLKAVNRGLRRASQEYNGRPEVRDSSEPPFAYGIICCAMRMFQAGFSEYYSSMMHAHRHAPDKEVYAMASKELARAAVKARDEEGLPIVGFDLAGEETGYPAEDHIEAYKICQNNFLKKTVHAGEAYGPESIYQAITALGADRIGHGTYLLHAAAIKNPLIRDRERYVEQLCGYIADQRITLEICLTSNMQTNPDIPEIAEHPFRKMRDVRLSTTICTDNRTVSRTTVTDELRLAVGHLGLNHHDLKSIIIYGFKRSFFPGPYPEKRRYVRQIIDYYESIERRFLA